MAYMTKEGYEQLSAQLKHMEQIERPAASAAIAEARDKGDLSENSEYDEAMSDQAKLEARISEIETMIKNAKVFDDSTIGNEVVHIGSKVTIQNSKKEKFEYKIVGFAQSNPDEGKISDECPVGKALLGHKVGDKVSVEAPIGTITYKITAISK